MSSAFSDVTGVVNQYFEGLYRSDSKILRRVFHPAALYACASDGSSSAHSSASRRSKRPRFFIAIIPGARARACRGRRWRRR